MFLGAVSSTLFLKGSHCVAMGSLEFAMPFVILGMEQELCQGHAWQGQEWTGARAPRGLELDNFPVKL